MTTMTLQTMLWCLLGFVIGAAAAYLLAKLIAPSQVEALEAASESAHRRAVGRPSGGSSRDGDGR